tara:strand:- start:442 stop:1050 length:609 start_codon:yes stop_codon:yes gene_type:complete
MKPVTYIIDDFYNNPLEVRDFALRLNFDVTGNFPGKRTKPHVTKDIQDSIEEVLFPHYGKISNFNTTDYEFDKNGNNLGENYNGTFYLTFEDDIQWYHADVHNRWAGVLYLNPDVSPDFGTGIYKWLGNNSMFYDYNNKELMDTMWKDCQSNDSWQLVDQIGNVFNRLVLYRGDLFHKPLKSFGNNLQSGRLVQVFFFDTFG